MKLKTSHKNKKKKKSGGLCNLRQEKKSSLSERITWLCVFNKKMKPIYYFQRKKKSTKQNQKKFHKKRDAKLFPELNRRKRML